MLQNPFYKGVQREAKTVIEGHFKEAYHLRYWNHVRGQNVRGPDSDTKRRPITPSKVAPYKGPTLLGPTARPFCAVDSRYSDPPGYLILSILPLPLFKGKGGSPGASRRSTPAEWSEVSQVRPEPTTAEESPPIRREEERPGPMVIASSENKT